MTLTEKQVKARAKQLKAEAIRLLKKDCMKEEMERLNQFNDDQDKARKSGLANEELEKVFRELENQYDLDIQNMQEEASELLKEIKEEYASEAKLKEIREFNAEETNERLSKLSEGQITQAHVDILKRHLAASGRKKIFE